MKPNLLHSREFQNELIQRPNIAFPQLLFPSIHVSLDPHNLIIWGESSNFVKQVLIFNLIWILNLIIALLYPS